MNAFQLVGLTIASLGILGFAFQFLQETKRDDPGVALRDIPKLIMLLHSRGDHEASITLLVPGEGIDGRRGSLRFSKQGGFIGLDLVQNCHTNTLVEPVFRRIARTAQEREHEGERYLRLEGSRIQSVAMEFFQEAFGLSNADRLDYELEGIAK